MIIVTIFILHLRLGRFFSKANISKPELIKSKLSVRTDITGGKRENMSFLAN